MKQKRLTGPVKSPRSPILRHVQCVVAPEVEKQLQAIAKASGRTVSSIVRVLVHTAVTDKGFEQVIKDADAARLETVKRYFQSSLFQERVIGELKKP